MTDNEKTAFDLIERFRIAFAFFNGELFDNRLSPVIITTQRHGGAASFFCAKSYQERSFDEKGEQMSPGFFVHEIAIMPDAMYNRPDREVLSTLVHEMVHLQQYEQGNPSRNGYHNKQWGELMRKVGLEPSSHGRFDIRNPELTDEERKFAVRGVDSGQKVSHFIIPSGFFNSSCTKLLKGGFKLNLQQSPLFRIQPRKSKLKYTCNVCGVNAWGKQGIKINCGECLQMMEQEKEMMMLGSTEEK